MAAAAMIASPASAQRGIDIDNPFSLRLDVCTLGLTCTGNSLSSIDDLFYGSATVGGETVTYFEDRQVFIYNEGVVSFDNELPTGASVAGGLASLGSGDWFAPGLSNTLAFAFNDGLGKIRVQWGAALDSLDFSFAIQRRNLVSNPTPFVQFGYSGDPPGYPPGLVTGYNYTPFSGVISGTNPNDGVNAPYDETLAGFDLRYAGSSLATTTVVPEPGTWALMILGFGLAGAALRRRESVLTRG